MKPYYTLPSQHINESWQPEAVLNNKIHTQSNINSNWKYRQYMQNNASHIMKYNSMESIYSSGNNPYSVTNNKPESKTPYMFTSLHDNSLPNYNFDYYNSDLKQNFVSNQQLQARMVAPIMQVNPDGNK
jgi:hypothetical protein